MIVLLQEVMMVLHHAVMLLQGLVKLVYCLLLVWELQRSVHRRVVSFLHEGVMVHQRLMMLHQKVVVVLHHMKFGFTHPCRFFTAFGLTYTHSFRKRYSRDERENGKKEDAFPC